ncbi:MAG: DNA-3-methyladenine glycosylase 2 family protein [Deltaproteobacteria bacterium]|nr:DNA-3-methyladenine glycosylase 2 family protein [Deltaproteobacteria bacterium]
MLAGLSAALETEVSAVEAVRSRARRLLEVHALTAAARCAKLGAMASGAGPPVATRHRLRFTPPLDWPALLGFLGARAIPGVEAVDGRGYRRTIAAGGATGVVEVALAAGGGQLAATIRLAAAVPRAPLVARLRRLFDLDAPLGPIAATLSADPLLARLVAARPGLRVPGAWDPFELAVRAILGQQVTVAAATALAGRLAAVYGEPLAPGAPAPGLVFPPPARLAAADLAPLGMPRARAAAIAGLAAAAAADAGLFAEAPSLEAAVARLRRLRGVGEWTAQYIAMRALRAPDAFPPGDTGLLRALATRAGRPTPAQLLARAERWRPFRAYAALHLWSAGAGGWDPFRDPRCLL